jgi:hypothetical protein
MFPLPKERYHPTKRKPTIRSLNREHCPPSAAFINTIGQERRFRLAALHPACPLCSDFVVKVVDELGEE